jgi:hypothetical protein
MYIIQQQTLYRFYKEQNNWPTYFTPGFVNYLIHITLSVLIYHSETQTDGPQ